MLPDRPAVGKVVPHGHDLDEVEVVVVTKRGLAVLLRFAPQLDLESVELAADGVGGRAGHAGIVSSIIPFAVEHAAEAAADG